MIKRGKIGNNIKKILFAEHLKLKYSYDYFFIIKILGFRLY